MDLFAVYQLPGPQRSRQDLAAADPLLLVPPDLIGQQLQGTVGVVVRPAQPVQTVQQFVDALPFQGAAPVHREQTPRPEGPSGGFPAGAVVQRPFQIRFQQGVVGHGHLLPHFVGQSAAELAKAVVPPAQLFQNPVGVGAGQIGFIEEAENRDTPPLQQLPQPFRPGRNGQRRANDQNGRIQRRQTPLHFRREIAVARRIQEKIPVIPVGKNGLGRKHRNASGPLHGGKVHAGSAVIHPAQGPQRPTPIQQLFRQGGFAAVHLG